MKLTAEQEEIIAAARDDSENLMINALAGTGKTTMLELTEREIKTRPILYLCFQKSVATEATERMQSTTTVRTFNSIGHRIWADTIKKKLTLDFHKTGNLLRSVIDEVPKADQQAMWDSFYEVVQGVALAKALGYVPEGKFATAKRLCGREYFHTELDESPDDLTADLIDIVLTRSITTAFAGNIDFNDQVYMPAVFGGIFPKYPLVLVDEAQDLNPANHALLDKLIKSRAIFVGDPFQSIYGFRGAVQGGMATLAEKFKTTPLDLSISFRCPQAIVENARWRVPHFKWIKEGGHVEQIQQMAGADFDECGTILCRNNAPLFRCALRLLSAGRSVTVAGSEIGPRVVGIMRKLGPENLSKEQTFGAIEEWRFAKTERGSKVAGDLADCMRVFAEHGESLGQAIGYAEYILKQEGQIRLMTGHKAKGLEFDNVDKEENPGPVYHLDQFLCREDEQDQNLRYVIQTRSANRYLEINSDNIRWA